MALLFPKKAHPILGIDISSTAAKVLALSRDSGSRLRVESFGLAAIPPDAIVENNIKDLAAVSEALQLALGRARPNTQHAGIAMPSTAVISKVLQVDATLSDEELEAHIELEAASSIPFPLEEVRMDFTVLGINEKDPSKSNVLLVASRMEHVDARIDVLEEAGLIVDFVDVETFAVERATNYLKETLPDNGINKTVAVIDFGATMTTLTVLYNMQAIYSREEIFGGRQLTEAIQRRYHLSYEDAGRMKKIGGLPDDYKEEVLYPFRESLIPLVRRSMQFFLSSGHGQSVDHILLAGGGANIDGLSDMISERLSAPCTVVNPFINMSLSRSINEANLHQDASSLLVCSGLALRGFPEYGTD